MDEHDPLRYSGTAIFTRPKLIDPDLPTAGSITPSSGGTAIASAVTHLDQLALTEDQVIYGAGAFWGFVGYSAFGPKGGIVGAVSGALYKKAEFNFRK